MVLYFGSSSTFTLCTFQGNRALEGETYGHNVYVYGRFDYPSSASFYDPASPYSDFAFVEFDVDVYDFDDYDDDDFDDVV